MPKKDNEDKEYGPDYMIGGPAAPSDRAKDMVRVFPSDEKRKLLMLHAADLDNSEIHGSESDQGAGVAFSKSEFKKRYGFEAKSLLEDK